MGIMKNRRCAAAFASILLVIAGAAGCRARNAPVFDARNAAVENFTDEDALAKAEAEGKFLRSAGVHVAAPTRPYFASGLGLLVAGGLAAIVGAKAMGFAAMGLGAAVAALGVVIVQYPWAILLAFLLAVAAAVAALVDRWRQRRALVATTQVIQTLPEGKAIKQGLAGLGAEIEAQVRAVVTPIKKRLRREGKI